MTTQDDAKEAFERIWKNEARGGDYQIVENAISNMKLRNSGKKETFKGIGEYKRRIEVACAFMADALQYLPDRAVKKRLQNYIKSYARYDYEV